MELQVRKLEELIYSILINGLIVIGVYYYVQPDDKGIIFWLFLAAYGFLSSFSGLILHLRKWTDDLLIKDLVMVANFTNFFWFYEFIRSILNSYYDNVNLISIPLYLSSLYGCFISVRILYKDVLRN